MKNILYIIVKYVNFFFATAIILSYASVYGDPERFWVLAFFGLSYPFILLFNFAFIIFWVFRKNKLFLVSLIVILIGWNHLRSFVQFPLRKKSPDISNSFTILSYNVRLFNLYNWNQENNTHEKIFDFINKNELDIICFQEFMSHTKGGHLTEKEMLQKLGNKFNAHFSYSITNSKSNYGIATFSKFPIVKKGVIKFSSTSNISIYTDVVINKDTIRIFNNHLQSIRFNKNNYSLINNSKNLDEESKIREVKDIFGRLKDAFIKRATQAELLSGYIKNSPYPVIVCGDFNDTPVSYTYNKMRGKLNDSFIESGKGIGNTYIGKFPSFRIDFIFYSDELECTRFAIPNVKLSDHYPVLGRYKLIVE